MTTPLRFKIAETEAEFEAIHRLNHRTFAEEIPQHAANPQGRLVDKFHAENTYAICLEGDQLAGMVAGRAVRPFSLDGKLDGLDAFLPEGRKPVEIRLLAVEPAHRHSTVLARLVEEIACHFAKLGCDLALISGTTRALQLYRRMGFVPFGPVVGEPNAQYQPMYLTAETTSWWRINPAASQRVPQNFLPGPVAIAPEVAAAMSAPAAYHRSESYLDSLSGLHTRLASFVNAPFAQLLMGSGTLANDVVAGQLKLLDQPGLIISEGEFGDRLIDHASRMGLSFTVAASVPATVPTGTGWLWTVHCETSTGTLTDLENLATLCAASEVKLCVDCISSLGTVPIDLSKVYLASGSSGKALGAYPGLSMVFYRDRPPSGGLPRYLDLGMYVAAQGVAFTQSSNLVSALDVALSTTNWADRFARLAHAGAWLHTRLSRLGFDVVAPQERAAPGICTIALPPEVDSIATGARMEEQGYLVATQSGYLRRHNWLQVSLMGQWTLPVLRALPAALYRAAFPRTHEIRS